MSTWTVRTISYASSDADFEKSQLNFTYSEKNIEIINEKFQQSENAIAAEKAEIKFYTDFIDEIDKEYVGQDGHYQYFVKNENGTIKKCNNNNGELSFILKNETLSGTFSKIKHDYKSFDAYKTKDGKLIIYRIEDYRHSKKLAILISRNGDENRVYNLKGDAFQYNQCGRRLQ